MNQRNSRNKQVFLFKVINNYDSQNDNNKVGI